MRRLWYAVVPLVVAGLSAGCTRVPPVDPGPSTTTPVVVSVTPSTATPTPVVTPTPTWDANQQGAIDAVQEYLTVWADIGQHLPDSDLERIREFAGDPLAESDVQTWALWSDNGWHLVGGPVFEVISVVPSMIDSKGARYYVHGCYIIEGSYVVDSTDAPIPTESRVVRAPGRYVVLRSPGGTFTAIDNVKEEGTC